LYNLVSFAGIFVLLGVAWLLSSDRKAVDWRPVLWGTALQLLFALFIFVVPAGSKAFLLVNDAVVKVSTALRRGPASCSAAWPFRRHARETGRSRSASSSPSRGCRRSSSSRA
jgi:CNT family concentrative nucleoside transporter